MLVKNVEMSKKTEIFTGKIKLKEILLRNSECIVVSPYEFNISG